MEAPNGSDSATITPAAAERLQKTVGLIAGLSPNEVRHRVACACRDTDLGHRAIAFYLEEIERRRLFVLSGHASAVHFAVSVLHLSERYAREHVSIGRALLSLRGIDEALLDENLTWSKVRLLMQVVTPEVEEAWLKLALSRSYSELKARVASGEKGKPPRESRRGTPHSRVRLSISIDPDTFSVWERARARLERLSGKTLSDKEALTLLSERVVLDAPESEERKSRRVRDSVYRVICEKCPDCKKVSVVTSKGTFELEKERGARIAKEAIEVKVPEVLAPDEPTPPLLREYVIVRGGGCCAHCHSMTDLDVHHIVFRAEGGKTVPSNLLGLCSRCHGMVHDRLLHITGEAPDQLVITDKEGQSFDRPLEPVGPKAEIRIALPAPSPLLLLPPPSHFASSVSSDVTGTYMPPLKSTPDDGFGKHPDRSFVSLESVPELLDLDRWRALSGTIRWNERRSVFELVDSPFASPAISSASLPAPRDLRFSDLVGQRSAISSLSIAIQAAKKRGTSVPHVLFQGPPGLGKTSLASALATEMGSKMSHTSGPMLEDLGTLLSLLTALADGDVFFQDEMHAIPKVVAEALYEAMEDRTLSIPITDGVSTKTVRIALSRFTLVGATTDVYLLPKPLRDRFQLTLDLEFYEPSELREIVDRAAKKDAVAIESKGATLLGRVSRGTPRDALRLYASVRDEAIARDETAITLASVKRTLSRLGIDHRGCTALERKLLALLKDGPKGISRLASMLGVPVKTVRDVIEPFLLRIGLLVATPRGRALAS